MKLQDLLSDKYEGRLFVEIGLIKFMGDSFTVSKDFYTVRNGRVFMVSNGQEEETKDSMINILTDCKRVGMYNKKKVYKRILRQYTYSEFKKLHKL